MARLAFFTPLPPIRSGISAYSAELLPLLAETHHIDVFVEDVPMVERSLVTSRTLVIRSAHEFVWRQARHSYDVIIYQIGNAPCHDYMWPYLLRYPGLLILHDLQLHHARARALLSRELAEEYRAEFGWNHPDTNPRIADVFAAGLGGTLFYQWPMLRTAFESSLLVAVHSDAIASEMSHRLAPSTVQHIRMGVAESPLVDASARASVLSRHQLPDRALLMCAFGTLTPEKRLSHAIRAIAWLSRELENIHLLLVGEPVGHYDARADAAAAGISERVRFTGYVPDEQLPEYLHAADVCLCLRWPTGGETSASWLRCLAARKATVTTDLRHSAEDPAVDPRTWVASGVGRPASVRIDLLDEDHSLRLALQRLAREPEYRRSLGEGGFEFWRAGHTLRHMQADYDCAIETTMRAPSRTRTLPPYLLRDGREKLVDLLAPFQVSSPL